MDIRYGSTDNDLTGYVEGGLLLAAVEQGVFYPEFWGYIGIIQPSGFGLGIGPNFTKYGIGLGISPKFYIESGNLLIPLKLNIAIRKDEARIQLMTGFSVAQKQE